MKPNVNIDTMFTMFYNNPEEYHPIISDRLNRMLPELGWRGFYDRNTFLKVSTTDVFTPRKDIIEITGIDFSAAFDIAPSVVYAGILVLCKNNNINIDDLLGFPFEDCPDSNYLLACLYLLSIITGVKTTFVEQLHDKSPLVTLTTDDLSAFSAHQQTKVIGTVSAYAPKKKQLARVNEKIQVVRAKVTFAKDETYKTYSTISESLLAEVGQARTKEKIRKVAERTSMNKAPVRYMSKGILEAVDDARREAEEESEVDIAKPDDKATLDAARKKSKRVRDLIKFYNEMSVEEFSELLLSVNTNARVEEKVVQRLALLAQQKKNDLDKEEKVVKENLRAIRAKRNIPPRENPFRKPQVDNLMEEEVQEEETIDLAYDLARINGRLEEFFHDHPELNNMPPRHHKNNEQ